MIEFTFSRVSLMVCGVALLAAILIPVQSMYDDRYDGSMVDVADKASYIIDEFWRSEADTMTLRGWEILPASDSYMEIDGHRLTIHHNNNTYSALISKSMDRRTIGYGDEVTITKEN